MWSYVKSFVRGHSIRRSKNTKQPDLEENPTSDPTPRRIDSVCEERKSRPPLAQHDSSVLDLAFVMDCTGSMGSYIDSATKNIRKIVEEIVANEKSNVNTALVEYRDHPPQDSSFVTRPHDFTPKIGKMKSWLEECKASGGGDGPEAVADGLHQLLKLSWRPEATKIAVLISDAPPHGLGGSGDGFPNGCPNGLDPMEITGQLAEKGVTLYVVGCEPSINCYRDFFMGLAYLTGGQYVPLAAAKALTQVIIGGAREEISLEKWMEEVNKEVQAEVEAKGAGNFDEDGFARRITERMVDEGVTSKVLLRNKAGVRSVSEKAVEISKMRRLSEVKASEVVKQGGRRRSRRRPVRSISDGESMSDDGDSDSDVSDGGASGFGSAHESDDYECASVNIRFDQVKSMVHKSKMRNKSWFRSGSDSD